MPTLLVQIFQHILNLGLFAILAKSEAPRQPGCDGPVC